MAVITYCVWFGRWCLSPQIWCCSDLCCCVSAVHLWRYRGGYPALTDCLMKLKNNKVHTFSAFQNREIQRKDVVSLSLYSYLAVELYKKVFEFLLFVVNFFVFPQEYVEFRKERAKMLLSRRNQLLLEFSFWNEPLPRPGPNIYELRTYHLKVSVFLFYQHISTYLCKFFCSDVIYN